MEETQYLKEYLRFLRRGMGQKLIRMEATKNFARFARPFLSFVSPSLQIFLASSPSLRKTSVFAPLYGMILEVKGHGLRQLIVSLQSLR